MKRIVMLAAACAIALPAFAQNVATVNGKAIPQKSLDQFVKLLVTRAPRIPRSCASRSSRK